MANSFHGTPLIISWLVLGNLAVMIASLRWIKYSFYFHLLLALVITGLTLASTISFIQEFLPNVALIKNTDQLDTKLMTIHKWVGFIFVCSLSIQIVLGFLSKFLKRSMIIHPNIVIWSRRIHMVWSYLVMLMAKFNYQVIYIKQNEIDFFVIVLGIDIICLLIYLVFKFKYYTFSQIITNYAEISTRNKQQNIINNILRIIKEVFVPRPSLSYQKDELEIIKYFSQDQIKLQKYIVFNDYVYDTKPLQKIHPGGQYLIKNTNKRQIDRFIYGTSPFELLPQVRVNNHNKDSLRMCGQPLAKLERSSPMIIQDELSKAIIIMFKQLAPKSSTYILHLKIDSKYNNQKQVDINQQFITQYTGYTHQKQFGQYFTLTIVGKNKKASCTRLYTTMWCMRPHNIEFMKINFPIFLQAHTAKNTRRVESINNQMQILSNRSEVIPLIIKKYEAGEFTSQLFAKDFKGECIISRPMGKGLDYEKLRQGKVIFISGGTGILPFCDFIDILFKRTKYLQIANISLSLVEMDPLIKNDFVQGREFFIYHSAKYVDDIPTLTLFQISELCKSQHFNFKAIFRISEDAHNIPEAYSKFVETTKHYFNDRIKQDHLGANSRNQISKIYICGSKQLNYQIGKLLLDENVAQNMYHFM